MDDKYNDISKLINAGQIVKARKIVQEIAKNKLERKEVLKVAILARRSSLWNVAFRLLHPIVRSGPKKVLNPSTEEKAEYASNLIRLGAGREGMDLLKSLNKEKYPLIQLFQAYGYFSVWEYDKAIPLLESYLTTKGLSEFESCIGKVNLAAAYVNERWEKKAEVILKELQKLTKKTEYWRLYGNVLELSAQFAIYQKNWKKADEILDESANVLSSSGGLDLLFVQKWIAISEALRNPANKKSQIPLNKVREEAIKFKHWETVRDCDLFLGVTEPNSEKLVRLYYGTPYEKYRTRIFEYLKFPLEIPSQYLFKNAQKDNPKTILDLDSGKIEGKENLLLIPGKMPIRLFKILTSDFYRPFRMPVLHAELYPGEYFNPISSPLRVHQALSRFRSLLKESAIKAEVLADGTSYRLQLTSQFAIMLPKTRAVHTIHSKRWEQIQKAFKQREFSIREIQKLFDCSPRTAQRVLLEQQQEGSITKIGASSSTRYRLTSF